MSRFVLLSPLATLLTLTACAAPAKPPPPAPAQELGWRESYEPAPVFGGNVHVLEAGPASAPPLILIHGLAEHAARDFDPILPALSRTHHVFAFDLPAFGSSTRSRQLYTPARYVQFVSELLQRHFDQPVDVLGHSMGGTLAIAYAGRYPSRVARLMLLDVAGVLYYRDYMLKLVDDDGGEADDSKNLFEEIWSEAKEAFVRVALSATSLEELRLEHRDELPSYLSPTSAAALMFIGHDFSRELQRITAPTWLGWGSHDDVAPERTAQLLRFMLRPVHVEIFPRSAHVPMKTEPERLSQSLLSFLAQPQSKPSPRERYRGSERSGSCVNQRDRLFVGDFDRIVIHGCKRVLLRNVRARQLMVERSQVELQEVELAAEDTAASLSRSRIRGTGVRIRAPVCIASDATHLDIAGVTCTASEQAMRFYEPADLVASVSWLEDPHGVRRLHGKIDVKRTHPARLPTLEAAELAYWKKQPSHSAPRFDSESWAGKRLAGEDLTGAALVGIHFEGTNLNGADLSAADLRDAHLRRSVLRYARLTGADLRRADITDAHVEHTDLRHADLREANFEESNLTGADLRGAKLEGARLAGARMIGAIYDASTSFSAEFDPQARGLMRDALLDDATQATGDDASSENGPAN